MDDNFDVKLTDMSSCIIKSNLPEKKLDTSYYRSPELLLRLTYDESSDMWAFGCTLYEILTGDILFNPDEFDLNKRYHLYLITQKLGEIPSKMIDQSKNKDVYFTCDMKKVKGFKKIYNDDLNEKLNSIINNLEKKEDEDIMNKIIKIIKGCVCLDPSVRLTTTQCLEILTD